MIFFLIICGILFFVYVFFYKQSISDYTILQLNSSQMNDKLKENLLEKAPIIIKDLDVPHCVQKQSLISVKRFQNIFIGSCNLVDYLEQKENCQLQVNRELENFLANETGFHSYVILNWLPKLYTNPISEYISSIDSRICFGSQQCEKTTAIWTLIMPVESKYIVSLVNPNYAEGMPTNYKTLQDLESVSLENSKKLQFIDVILKPRTMLLLPPHWFYLMKAETHGAYFINVEYNEPVSMLNKYLEKKI